jgi:hypothetical protein
VRALFSDFQLPHLPANVERLAQTPRDGQRGLLEINPPAEQLMQRRPAPALRPLPSRGLLEETVVRIQQDRAVLE